MIWRKPFAIGFVAWKSQVQRFYTNLCAENTSLLSKYLKISDAQAKFIYLKYPAVRNLDEGKIIGLLEAINKLGYSKEMLLDEPVLFCNLPITLQYRHQVLSECGIQNISPRHLASYLPIVKQYTLRELKDRKEISPHVNVENRLASYMTQWPTSLTTGIYGDMNDFTLYSLRLNIIQKYLEFVLELTSDEFQRGIQTYPTTKHRPLAVIHETLSILKSEVMMPTEKIKSNLYLIHADPHNLKKILYKLRSLGGIDVKEIIKMYPKIALKNYSLLIEIKNILQEFGINDEAQRRCFNIYTLSPDTIRERLEKAKGIPEFETFYQHPRFLKMIYHNKTAMKRLQDLYKIDKKCLSLNILSGCSAHYDVFEKSPGDRMGKGKDLIFCLTQCFENKYTSVEIRKSIKRHPYWINIPLIQVKYVHKKLLEYFSSKDVYENCPILLYPWNKIKSVLKLIQSTKSNKIAHYNFITEHVDVNSLSKSQILSLVLYILEQNHYFSGNGVWSEEKLSSAGTINVKKAES